MKETTAERNARRASVLRADIERLKGKIAKKAGDPRVPLWKQTLAEKMHLLEEKVMAQDLEAMKARRPKRGDHSIEVGGGKLGAKGSPPA